MTRHRNDSLTLAPALAFLIALALPLVGCDEGGKPNPSTKGAKTTGDHKDHDHGDHKGADKTAATVNLPEGMLVTEAPGEPVAVDKLKETAKEGDEVVMRVTVGGRVKPHVDGKAIVTVVEANQFNKCITPEDHCATPWDYCCVAKEVLVKQTATVQMVDDAGKPLALNLADSALKPLTTVVVKGKVGPRPDPNVLTVNASAVFIEKGK